jgi:UDP-GlcNAc:undecaprenyl-phosphate/decaprenyl-phosphate GlcNAc-1-phosphate transferase
LALIGSQKPWLNFQNGGVLFAVEQLVWIVTLPLVASCAVAIALLLTSHLHINWTADHPEGGPQKIHTQPTIRVGGLTVVAGLVAGLLCVHFTAQPQLVAHLQHYPAGWLIGCGALLVFLGLAEDITGTVSVRLRLFLSLSVGAVLWLFAGLRVTHADLPGLDQLLAHWPAFSMVFTMVAMGGLVHAMNIVDGLNGLLAGINLVVLAAIALVASRFGQPVVALIALIGMSATLGFALFNFPRAHMFCGDAGAYVMGYVAAVLLVSLMQKQVVSPWFGLAVVIHPVVETLYSAWRRYRNGDGAMLPDTRHMHSLWMRYLRAHHQAVWLGPNAGGSLRTVALASIPAFLATFWPTTPVVLMALCALYVVAFIAVVRTLDSVVESATDVASSPTKVTL